MKEGGRGRMEKTKRSYLNKNEFDFLIMSSYQLSSVNPVSSFITDRIKIENLTKKQRKRNNSQRLADLSRTLGSWLLFLGLRVEFDELVGHALRPVEGPVAGRDVVVVDEVDGALENVQRVLVDPAVPVALVELLTVGRVAEEAGADAHLGPHQRLVAQFLVHALQVPVTEHFVSSAFGAGGRFGGAGGNRGGRPGYCWRRRQLRCRRRRFPFRFDQH